MWLRRISKVNIEQRIKSKTLVNWLKKILDEKKRTTKSHTIANNKVSYNAYPIESLTLVKFIEV